MIFAKQIKTVLLFLGLTLLIACSRPSNVVAQSQERLFLDLEIEFLGEYQLPKTTFEDTVVGGLSGLTYNRQTGQFYALSDDRSTVSPARFYTLNLEINQDQIDNINIEAVTFLKTETGVNYPQGQLDPESIALSPRQTVFIASEGDINKNIVPFIAEFDLETGAYQKSIPLPQRYLPDETEETDKGIQNNLGFEALTLNQNSLSDVDPFRLFTAPESSLIQDGIPEAPEEKAPIRFLHYLINPFGSPVLAGEHLYWLEPGDSYTLFNGLTEMITLPAEGYFLTLERTYGFLGANAKLFQMVVADATDISTFPTLQGIISQINPLHKQLLLDLSTLGIELDNLEGMSLGSRLADGSQSLILVSDDNFSEAQVTQFLLFKLQQRE